MSPIFVRSLPFGLYIALLALEGLFGVEFPDRMLKRSVFSSIASIQQALNELTAR